MALEPMALEPRAAPPPGQVDLRKGVGKRGGTPPLKSLWGPGLEVYGGIGGGRVPLVTLAAWPQGWPGAGQGPPLPPVLVQAGSGLA